MQMTMDRMWPGPASAAWRMEIAHVVPAENSHSTVRASNFSTAKRRRAPFSLGCFRLFARPSFRAPIEHYGGQSAVFGAPFGIKLRTRIPLKFRYNF